jgi:WD40 repeat protein
MRTPISKKKLIASVCFLLLLGILLFVFLQRFDQKRVVILRGYDGGFSCLAFSPLGQVLASGSREGKIILWDLENNMKQHVFEGHQGNVTALDFSKDGKLLGSSSADQTIKIWDLETKSELGTLTGSGGGVLSLAFLPDGHELVSEVEGGGVLLWNIESRTFNVLIGQHKGLNGPGLALSPDGKSVATIDFGEKVPAIWDLPSGNKTAGFEGNDTGLAFYSIAISPNGRTLATGTWQWFVLTWDVQTRKEARQLHRLEHPVVAVAFSPDGRWLASAEARGGQIWNQYPSVRVWEIETGREVCRLKGSQQGFSDVKFSPNGEFLAAASNDGSIRLWLISEITSD